MNNIINKLSILSILVFSLFSCEKEGDQVFLKPGAAPVLTASADNVVLTEEEAKNEAISLSWTPADFGFDAAGKYTLQIDTAGDGFVKPLEMPLGNKLEKAFTVEELNNLLIKAKYEPEVAHDIDVRVKVVVADAVAPVYSNLSTLSLTPYSTFVEPGYIYVPGGYQGWDPGTAPALLSVEDNGVYEGVISLVGAESLEFKFTDERSWDLNYGKGDAEGTLSENGPNLSVPEADSYLLTVDLNEMTWSAKKNSWGIIGSATPGGWDTDTNMIFDSEEGVWKITADLVAGELKFRLNDDWGTNYGDDDTSNDLLNAGGANIPIAGAGTYEIVLDLREEESPKYSITQL